MNDNIIDIRSFIKKDKKEKVGNMKKNRGVGHNGKFITVQERVFSDYIVKRIDLIRTEGNEYYIKNQVKKIYQKISTKSLTAVFMSIMEECGNYYDYLREERLCTYVDKKIKVLKAFKEDKRFLVFPNGIYDLETYTFDSSFKEDVFTTYQMAYMYDENAECVEWKNALSKMFMKKEQDSLILLQEIFGYIFCVSSKADKLFYFFGRGRNGKSIVCNVMGRLIGEENIASSSFGSLTERFELSHIYNKRVCICPENSKAIITDTSVIKALTGRDSVKIELKYQQPFSEKLSTKIIVNSNHYLKVNDNSYGFWKRILPVNFRITFVSQEDYDSVENTDFMRIMDTNLEEKLDQELSGIFNWAMEGLKRLQGNNWNFTEIENSKKLKNEMMGYSIPVMSFVKEQVRQGNYDKKRGKVNSIKSSLIHSYFLNWVDSKFIDARSYRDSRVFHKEFKDTLFKVGIRFEVKKNSVDYYKGICIKDYGSCD